MVLLRSPTSWGEERWRARTTSEELTDAGLTPAEIERLLGSGAVFDTGAGLTAT